MPVRPETARRFRRNLERATFLLGIHEGLTERRRGRPDQHAGDILRAAVVLAHATLEDLLRGLAEQYWPSAGPEVLGTVPLKGHTKLAHSLRDLAPHRTRTVQDVLEESIHAYLQRETFDSAGEVQNHLTTLGVDMTRVEGNMIHLKEMIQRRHHIVHQADKGTGRGVNSTKPIQRDTVRNWLEAARAVGESAMTLLP